MASSTQVIAVGPQPGALAVAEERLRQLEMSWSRFIETSDISRVNQHPGHWVPVSGDTIRLIDTMQLASAITSRGFDPTHLSSVMALGYVSSIDDSTNSTMQVGQRDARLTIDDVDIDRVGSALRLPIGLSLDPGGIGKGLAADIVVTELLAAGTAGMLISIGGDIAAAGEPPSEQGWIVNVDDPHQPGKPITTLAVSGGGVATSSTMSRRWHYGGSARHHIVDSASGTQSTTDLAAVTAVANAGWLAEAHATAGLLRGADGVIEYLDAHGLTGLAVTGDGAMLSTAALAVPVAQGSNS